MSAPTTIREVTNRMSKNFTSYYRQSEQTTLKLIQSTMETKWPNLESIRFFGRDCQSEFDSEAIIDLVWWRGEEGDNPI